MIVFGLIAAAAAFLYLRPHLDNAVAPPALPPPPTPAPSPYRAPTSPKTPATTGAVVMNPGEEWGIMAKLDTVPDWTAFQANLGSILASQGHTMTKFLKGDSGGLFAYRVKVGPSGVKMVVPSYDPPIAVTRVARYSPPVA